MQALKRYTVLVPFLYILIILNAIHSLFMIKGEREVDLSIWGGFSVCGIFLVTLGVFVYLKTHDNPTINKFFALMVTVGTMLVCMVSEFTELRSFALILLSFAPYFLYDFFCSFTRITKTKPYPIIRILLLTLAIVTMISYLTVYYQNISLAIDFIVAIFACMYMYLKYRHHMRPFAKWQSRLMIIALCLALVPFILFFIIPLFFNIKNSFGLYSSFFIIFLPLAVAYILIKQDVLRIERHSFFWKQISIIAGLCIALNLFLLFLNVDAILQIYINVFFLVALIVQFRISEYLADRHLRKIGATSAKLESEKLEIFNQVVYEDYLSSLNVLILELINKTAVTDGVILIWKDTTFSILEKTGMFEKEVFEDEELKKLPDIIKVIKLNDIICLSTPLEYKGEVNGWLVIGKRYNATSFEAREVNTIKQLSTTICEILITSELLYQSKKNYIKLPSITFDKYVHHMLLAETEANHKNFSIYLHDDVLQSLLGLKNLTSSLQGDEEIKDLLFSEFDKLNNSIRDKMFDTYPSSLNDLSFSENIILLLTQLGEYTNGQIEIVLECPSNFHLPKILRFPVYRIIKELNQNAIKHASASLIKTIISKQDHILSIVVVDNGTGFDLDNQFNEDFYRSHIGLLSIKQDVNSFNGELKIRSLPSQITGTQVYITIPMEEDIFEDSAY